MIRWQRGGFRKEDGREVGPLSFQNLVEMIRAGTLSEDDRVRMEHQNRWIAARDVLGLLQAAKLVPGQHTENQAGPIPAQGEIPLAVTAAKTAAAPPKDPSGQTARAPRPASGPLRRGRSAGVAVDTGSHSQQNAPAEENPAQEPLTAGVAKAARPRFRRLSRSAAYRLLGVCGLAILIATVWAGRSWLRHKPKSVLETIRAPRPAAPSVPGLAQKTPQLVPGLEATEPVWSPCLTPDLRTIVFSAMGNPGTGYDLYIAERKDVSEPFGPPRMIKSCTSPETDAYPALSPDGLELYFIRSDSHPQFFHCDRKTADGDFREAVPWVVPGIATAKLKVERLQFADALHLMFCVVDASANKCKYFLFERKVGKGPFDSFQEIQFPMPYPPYLFLAESGVRAYFSADEGLYVFARRSRKDFFIKASLLLDTATMGPIEGPLWVAPQEDVFFYISAGVGEKCGSARHLWMIRN